MIELVGEEVNVSRMVEVELFLFTDDSTSEWCIYKVTSTNPDLFYLMVRLKKLILQGVIKIHIIWVDGTQHIAAGLDAFS